MIAKELALFDLDHTLINVDSDYLWGEYLVKNGLVDEQQFRDKNRQFYEQYIDGSLDAVEYNEFVATFLSHHTLADLHTWRADYIAQDIAPNVRPKALAALNDHLTAGHDVLVVSATNAFVVKEIAKSVFNVPNDAVLATELELNEQGYSGRVAGRPNFKDGKIYHLERWLAKRQHEGVAYSKTYAYSDSKNDIPLLAWADVAVCVSPDDALHAYALAHHWAVEDWSL